MPHPDSSPNTGIPNKPQVTPPPNMPGKEQRQGGDYQGKPVPPKPAPDQPQPVK